MKGSSGFDQGKFLPVGACWTIDVGTAQVTPSLCAISNQLRLWMLNTGFSATYSLVITTNHFHKQAWFTPGPRAV